MYPLSGDQDPAPRLYCCFLTVPPLSLYPLPSWISNCRNLTLRTQGRPWRLNEAHFLKKWGNFPKEIGDSERLLCLGASQGPARPYLHLLPSFRLLKSSRATFSHPSVSMEIGSRTRLLLPASPYQNCGCSSTPLLFLMKMMWYSRPSLSSNSSSWDLSNCG